MPTFFFYGPELDTEKKRELIKTVTDKASDLTGITTCPLGPTVVEPKHLFSSQALLLFMMSSLFEIVRNN